MNFCKIHFRNNINVDDINLEVILFQVPINITARTKSFVFAKTPLSSNYHTGGWLLSYNVQVGALYNKGFSSLNGTKYGESWEFSTEENYASFKRLGYDDRPFIIVSNNRKTNIEIETVLYKMGKPIVSESGIGPGVASYLNVEPAIYVSVQPINKFKEGDSFNTNQMILQSTKFDLHTYADITVIANLENSTTVKFQFESKKSTAIPLNVPKLNLPTNTPINPTNIAKKISNEIQPHGNIDTEIVRNFMIYNEFKMFKEYKEFQEFRNFVNTNRGEHNT